MKEVNEAQANQRHEQITERSDFEFGLISVTKIIQTRKMCD